MSDTATLAAIAAGGTAVGNVIAFLYTARIANERIAAEAARKAVDANKADMRGLIEAIGRLEAKFDAAADAAIRSL
jgi:hypothetical protein